MAYLTADQMAHLGFKKLGKNVKISDKAVLYNTDQMEIGDHSRIDDFCVVTGRIVIGRNCHITVMCNLAGGLEGIEIGDFVAIAYGSHIFSQSDDYSGATMTNSTVPAKYKNEIKAKITIGRHCIVGAHSVIMPGVRVAEGCSVGAGTLLLKSTEPWGIYAGVPAKRLKERKRDMLELEKQYLQSEV